MDIKQQIYKNTIIKYKTSDKSIKLTSKHITFKQNYVDPISKELKIPKNVWLISFTNYKLLRPPTHLRALPGSKIITVLDNWNQNLLMYQAVNNLTFFMSYQLLFECFDKKELQNIEALELTTSIFGIESLLFYDSLYNASHKNKFHTLLISYLSHENKDYLSATEEQLVKLGHRFKNYSYTFDNNLSKIYKYSVHEKIINTLKGYNFIYVALQAFKAIPLSKGGENQCYFASILMALKILVKGGTLIISFRQYTNYVKQLLYMLTKYFSDIIFFSPKILPLHTYIVLKHYVPVSKSDYDVLINILKIWERKDEFGGQCIINDRDRAFIQKYAKQRKIKFDDIYKKSTNMFVNNLFYFDYDKNYDKFYNKIINRHKELLQLYNTLLTVYNLDKFNVSSDEFAEFVGESFSSNVRENIQLALKYNLSIIPKYIDYHNKFENILLQSIHSYKYHVFYKFTQFDEKCVSGRFYDTTHEYTFLNSKKYLNKLFLFKRLLKLRKSDRLYKIRKQININDEIKKYIKKSNDYLEFYELCVRYNIIPKKNNALSLYFFNRSFMEAGNKFGKLNSKFISKMTSIKNKKNTLMNNFTFIAADTRKDFNISQLVQIMELLELGGNLVLKIKLHKDICQIGSVLFLLYNHFYDVLLVKPVVSDLGKRSLYVICVNMKCRLNDSLMHNKNKRVCFSVDTYTTHFIYQFDHIFKNFVKVYIDVIKKLMFYYDYPEILKKHKSDIQKYQLLHAKEWINMMDI